MPVEAFSLSGVDALNHVASEKIPPLMVIAGPNGVGKSTLFENLAIEIDSNSSSKSNVNVEMTREIEPVYFSPHRAPTPVDISEELLARVLSRRYNETLRPRYRVSSDTLVTSGSGPLSDVFPTDSRTRGRLEADFAPYFEIKRRIAELHRERSEIATSMIDSEEENEDLESIDDLRKNLPNIKDYLRSAVDFVLPGVDFKGLSKEKDNYKLYFTNRKGQKVEFDQLSSGERDAIAILFSLIEPQIEGEFIEVRDDDTAHEDLLVLIDSPEAYLHPSLQGRLLEYIRRCINDLESTEWRLQVMICTHSQRILQKVSSDQLYFLVFPDQRKDSENQLISAEGLDVDQNLFDRISKNLGFSALSSGKPILLVEGGSDIEIFTRLHSGLESEVELIPLGGKLEVRGAGKAFDRLVPQLSQMGVKVAAIVDRDRDWDLSGEVEDSAFILPVTCVENFLVNANVLYDALRLLANRSDKTGRVRSDAHVEDQIERIIQSDEFQRKELTKRVGERLTIHIPLSGITEITSSKIKDQIDEIVEVKKDRVADLIEDERNDLEKDVRERNMERLDGKRLLSMIAEHYDVSSTALGRVAADRRDPSTLPEEYIEFVQGVVE